MTTQGIARNVAEAAQGSAEISRNITGVALAASNTTDAIAELQTAAGDLARLASELHVLVAQTGREN